MAMAKAEISWRRVSQEGVRLQVYARHVGREWRFFARERRYDQWQALARAAAAGLAGTARMLSAAGSTAACLRPEEEGRVKKSIRERFPEAEIGVRPVFS